MTNHENVKNSRVLESLMTAYNAYKGKNVQNIVLKKGPYWYDPVNLPYHPLQAVRIYFSTATYDEIGNDASMTFEDQISAIGGTMGLFAGFSILSAVEVFYFLLKFILSLVSKTITKIKNRR